jgi:regulator of sirC expression with transglutaminase-like and TPR domain
MSGETQDITNRELVHQRVSRIRRVLLDQWDPANISSNHKLADEYDSYLGGIVKALEEPVSVEQLARLLADIEDGWFDEDCTKERWQICLATARCLFELPDA